jgi:hypothetical protein
MYFGRKLKYMRFPSIVILFLCALTNCTTEFELEAPWRDVPIVYGFLSLQDTAHYIRVEKAFLEPGGDARQNARNVDSIYYGPEVRVFLEKINSGQRFELDRVEGNLEGYPRQEGPFAETPNILYKIKSTDINLRAGDPMSLLIDRGADLPEVRAETRVLDEITIRESNPVSPVNMDYERTVNFVFNVGEYAQVFDVRLLLHIEENRSGAKAVNTLEWVLANDLRRTSSEGRVSVGIMGESFYRYLADVLSPDSGLRREFLGFDVAITAGGAEFIELLRLQEANTGLTSAQDIPVYSNISEGLGIFSSRSTALREGLQITATSLDSLREGIFTRNLGF